MSTVVSFSQALRERTWNDHSTTEHAGFMNDLVKGNSTKEDYTALVAQHYFIYEALEAAAEKMADDPIAQRFIHPQLTRLPALEADLDHLIGSDWRERIAPLPATERYVDRLTTVAAQWNGGFIAHHYTRYLGDLSGGQFISRLMQRQFGFETNGVLFYLFDQIADPKDFKETYRVELDSVGWSPEEQDRVIDEVVLAYRLNTEVFTDLQLAKEAAAA